MFTTWRIVRPLRARLAPFACFEKRDCGGDRVFEGSEVDLTSRRRYEGPKRKEVVHARIYAKFTIRLDKDRQEISTHFKLLLRSFHYKNNFQLTIDNAV